VDILNIREPGDFDTHDFEYEFTLPFVQAKPAPTVLEWTPDEGEYSKQLQIHEFPGVIFERGAYKVPSEEREYEWHYYCKAIYPNGEEKMIGTNGRNGSIFIADVTGDGYPDFITAHSITSGVYSSFLTLYDFVNDELYPLNGYGGANVPFIEDGKLIVIHYQNHYLNNKQKFELGFENGELILVGFDLPVPSGEQSLSERLAALFRLNGSMEVKKGALDAIIEESKQKTPSIDDIKLTHSENTHQLDTITILSSFAPSLANINNHFPIEYIRRINEDTIHVVLKYRNPAEGWTQNVNIFFRNLHGGEENEDYNADTELWWRDDVLRSNFPGEVQLIIDYYQSKEKTGFYCRKIRTNVHDDAMTSGSVTVINSRTELEKYYERFSYTGDRLAQIFRNAIAKYDDTFFAGNYLAAVYYSEGSGSVEHVFTGIEPGGKIKVNRLIPEGGTDDMAGWHLFIELGNSFRPGQLTVETTNVRH
jgi:hypothetical protein